MSAHPRGAGLLHPGALISVAVLVLNDHLLKGAFPIFVTGKLSDLAGLAFFPLFLQAGLEWLGAPVSRRVLAGACLATAAVFVGVKTVQAMHAVYEIGLGLLQFPFRALAGGAGGRVALQMDPTDLVAVPAVALAWRWGRDLGVAVEAPIGGRRDAPDTAEE